MRKVYAVVCLLWLVILGFIFTPGVQACDTFVAMPDATREGIVILGKNSDRLVFDSQPLILNPGSQWPEGSMINLGRLSLPQVNRTFTTLGSNPYWCWGYEEGMNEYGVAIGNEGVATRPLVEGVLASERGEAPEMGPTGMDLIRLALERSKTAREAVEVIAGLTEKFGQFGSGLPTQGVGSAYDNSYIVTDPREAWILETAGRRWAAKKVTGGVASISNKLGIETEWDLASDDLVEYAVARGWWDSDSTAVFDFSTAYSPEIEAARERIERARVRQQRSCRLLEEKAGEVDLAWMKRISRDRATEPGIDVDQTASSCVVTLPPSEEDIPVFWWCAARPSNSCYVPFFVHGSSLPEIVSRAGTYGKRVISPGKAEADSFSSDSYWWLFRDLSDRVAEDWDKRHPVVRAAFDSLEAEFESGLDEVLEKADALRSSRHDSAAAGILDRYTASCVARAVEKVNALRGRFETEAVMIPPKYEPYVGTYTGNFGPFQEAPFEVKVQNGHLAVDVPGQMVFEMKDPGQDGLWYFALTDLVAVDFMEDVAGDVAAMRFHQTTRIPRADSDTGEQPEEVPAEYRPYVGKYMIAPGTAEVTVLIAGGRLALDIPDEATIELTEPNPQGKWYFAGDPTTSVSFEMVAGEEATHLNLHQAFELPRAR